MTDILEQMKQAGLANIKSGSSVGLSRIDDIDYDNESEPDLPEIESNEDHFPAKNLEPSNISNKKIKSLQMKSIKTLSQLINASLKNAGRDLLTNKNMIERFQDDVVVSTAEVVFLHKQFVLANHVNIVDLNKSGTYSYRLAWGINSRIYAKAVELGLDANKATKLFTKLLIAINGDNSNPVIDSLRVKLGVDGLSDENKRLDDERMLKVISTNAFDIASTNEESLYYTVCMGWSRIYNALQSDSNVLIDGVTRSRMRKLFEKSVTDLFSGFSQGCESNKTYNMLLKSCITQVSTFQATIINISIDSLRSAKNPSFGHLYANAELCMNELLERLTFTTEICTQKLLEAENGELVEGASAYKSDVNPTSYFLALDKSVSNYMSSIHNGLQPRDIASRYLMLQKLSLDMCDLVYRRFGFLSSKEIPESMYRMVYDSISRVNSVLPVLNESEHSKVLRSIVDGSILALTQLKLSDAQLKAVGFNENLKFQVNENLLGLSKALRVPLDDPQLNLLVLTSIIEANAKTRTFAWGIHEGLVGLSVVNSIIEESTSIFLDSPVPNKNINRVKSYETSLVQTVKIFERIWDSTSNETLAKSEKRYCIGDINYKTAKDIISEFNREMKNECYSLHSNAIGIYESLLNNKNIKLDIIPPSSMKPTIPLEMQSRLQKVME